MKVTLLALGGLLAAASFCACNNDDDNTDTSNIVNSTDSNFVMMAGLGNTAEIRAADSALAKSQDSVIRNFATMMKMDHTDAQNTLKGIASPYGLTVPDTIDAAHAAKAAIMSTLTGRAFDSMYIHEQVLDHQTSVQLYTDEKTSGNNVNLVNFANTTLPKLQTHLDSANRIASTY